MGKSSISRISNWAFRHFIKRI